MSGWPAAASLSALRSCGHRSALMLFRTRTGPEPGSNASRKASTSPIGFFLAVVLRKSNEKRKTKRSGGSPRSVRERRCARRTSTGSGKVRTGFQVSSRDRAGDEVTRGPDLVDKVERGQEMVGKFTGLPEPHAERVPVVTGSRGAFRPRSSEDARRSGRGDSCRTVRPAPERGRSRAPRGGSSPPG